MDPDATWLAMLTATNEENWIEAADAANELLKWLRGGGFPPSVSVSIPGSSGQLTSENESFNRCIADAVAREVHQRASAK